jgi:putative membrane protein
MQVQRSFSDKIFLVLKGIAMGLANKIPGVSGGVVAFVAGFYEEFIYSFKRINKTALKFLISGRFKSLYRYINGQFLFLLILGIIISFFSVSKILDFLLKDYEIQVWSCFFGMIIGSIYYINKDFEGVWTKTSRTALIVGALLGISISFFDPATENSNLLFVFLCGIISVSGMTLPGLSGSFIMMLMGNYVLLLVDSVNSLYDTFADIFVGDFSFINNPERIHLLKVLVAFTLGSVTGLVTFSNLLSYLIKHFKKVTYASILGFIIGSLGVVWPWKHKVFAMQNGNYLIDRNGNHIVATYKRYLPELSNDTYWAIFYIFIGILLVLGLEWYGARTRKN